MYITAKNVPPKTIKIEGTSINGPTPPPETIAKTIMPMAPSNPISDAKSIISPQLNSKIPLLQKICSDNLQF